MKVKTAKKTAARTKKEAAKKTAARKNTVAGKTASPSVKAPKKSRVTFTYRAEAGSKVYLAGSFNDWNPSAKKMTDKKKNGIYTATVVLPPGSYEYKFIINGTWCADPECADWVQNDHGTLNSVKHVTSA
ncbi:MAG: glycogen-binding domain-containing protein [Kiritimatiellia bacterium]